MIRFLIVFMLVIPFVDLYLLIEAISWLGFWEVTGLILLTGIIGAELIRREGRHVLRKIGSSYSTAEAGRNLVEGAVIALCGVLLLTPGFLTDGIGFFLLLRPIRRMIASRFVDSKSTVVEVRTV